MPENRSGTRQGAASDNIARIRESSVEAMSDERGTAAARGNLRRHILIRDSLLFIDDHYSKKITLKEVADSVHLSPNHFSSLFSSACNCTFITYVRYKRVSVACELLKHTQLSIMEIAARVSYSNISHFNELFKKVMGMSPGRYRDGKGLHEQINSE
jgi:two-component system, response regulator YesN